MKRRNNHEISTYPLDPPTPLKPNRIRNQAQPSKPKTCTFNEPPVQDPDPRAPYHIIILQTN